jgi:hypothetical protein
MSSRTVVSTAEEIVNVPSGKSATRACSVVGADSSKDALDRGIFTARAS